MTVREYIKHLQDYLTEEQLDYPLCTQDSEEGLNAVDSFHLRNVHSRYAGGQPENIQPIDIVVISTR